MRPGRPRATRKGGIAPKVTEVPDETWMTAVSLQGAYNILADLTKAFGVDIEVPHVA